jgi:NAD(P)-dependent dehydrogenase (short-subunit alcohol dehydrogenase family)
MSRFLVIGANRGIGLELVRQIAQRGDEVIAACRTVSPALSALGLETFADVDVCDDAGLRALSEALAGRDVDVLVVVAGILHGDGMGRLDWDAMRRQFEVNSLGPLRAALALRPRLKRGSKIAILSSRVGSLADNTSGGNYGYRMSKAAVNMAGRNLAHDLAPEGIAVLLLHPGYVRTDMTRGSGHIDASESARGLIQRLDELGMDQTGTFWHADGSRLPW